MRTKISYLALIMAIFLLSMTDAPAENDVYRWVDENGVVHFESQAPEQADAEKIPIKQKRSGDDQYAVDTAGEDIAKETNTETSYAQQRRDERTAKRKEAVEKEKLTAARCENSRMVVAKLEPMTRVIVEQEDGTMLRMDDNDRLEKLGEAKAYIAENCSK